MVRTVTAEAEVGDRAVSTFVRCHATPHAPGGLLAASAAVTETMTLKAPKRVRNENLDIFFQVTDVE